MRRMVAGIGVLAVLSLGAGGRVAPNGVPEGRTQAQLCQAAVRAFAKLTPPASLQAVPAAVTAGVRAQPMWSDLNLPASSRYSDLVAQGGLDPLLGSSGGYKSTDIATNIADGDGPVATNDVAELQRVFAAIDRARKKEHLPAACSSGAWGSGYFLPALATLVKGLTLTGDFTTDANAACARLDKRTATAAKNLNPDNPESAVSDLDQAFRAFQVDLQAIPAPPGPPPQYTSFRSVIDGAVKTLDHANATVHTPDLSVLHRLSQQISTLAAPVTSGAAALGLNC